jgi:hypothetical protein
MSGYMNFAVFGVGDIGRYIVEQLLQGKAAGVVLTHQVKYSSNNHVTRDMKKQPGRSWRSRTFPYPNLVRE